MTIRYASICGISEESGEYVYYGPSPRVFDEVTGMEIVDGPHITQYGRRINPRDPISFETSDPREVYEILARTPLGIGGRQAKPFCDY